MLTEDDMVCGIVCLLGDMCMDELKRRNVTSRFIRKVIIAICTVCVIFSTELFSYSQLSFDSNLFLSAVYSLLIFSFWIGAGWILRKPKSTSLMVKHATMG